MAQMRVIIIQDVMRTSATVQSFLLDVANDCNRTISDILNRSNGMFGQKTDSLCIGQLLYSIGVQTRLCGHLYLVRAIERCVREPLLLARLTKELYPAIAQEYATNTLSVERAIRHALEIAWKSDGGERYRSIFGSFVPQETPKRPTAGDVISAFVSLYRSV